MRGSSLGTAEWRQVSLYPFMAFLGGPTCCLDSQRCDQVPVKLELLDFALVAFNLIPDRDVLLPILAAGHPKVFLGMEGGGGG
jgi:hypothetical protein